MDEMRIVILGKTGVGKSSVANTILGESVFKVSVSGNSETSECQSETRRVDGRDVTLIDTPDWFDTDRPEEEMKAETARCITECSPEPHAFIIVLKVEPFTDQEQAVIDKIIQFFTDQAFKYATLLFTHGDQLDEEQTIEEYFLNNQLVRDLMKKCGGRCHVVDNKYWKNNQQDEYRSNRFQVKQLLKTIQKIRKSTGIMTEEEIRKEAKERTCKRLLINLAGITTGALLGALFGGVLLGGLQTFFVQGKKILESRVQGGTTVGRVGGVAGAEAAGMTVSVMMACVLVGAIKGGVTGYNVAAEADTASEAVKRTATAVFNILFVF